MAFLNETGLERLWTHIIGRLNGLVQSSRTINGQPLTEDIVLTPDMIGADTKGSASAALTQAKSYTDSALNTAKSYSDTNLNTAKSYTDSEIADLINSAPTTLDTLGEIATAMEANEGVVAALDAAIGSKAASSDLTAHTGNGNIHVTAAEKTLWNSVEQGANKTVIDSALSASSTNPVQNKIIKGELDSINDLIEANAVVPLTNTELDEICGNTITAAEGRSY